MAAISGVGGTVNSFTEVTDWTMDVTVNANPYGSSSTGGWKKRVIGTKDIKGTIKGKFDGALPVTIGESVALVLGVADGYSYSGNAVIEKVGLEVNINDGDIVGWSADWGGDGEWTGV